MDSIELEQANLIVQGAVTHARGIGCLVSVSVCDRGGHLISFARMKDASALSSLIAVEKSRACALSGKATGHLEDMVNGGRFAALSMPVLTMKGGIPIEAGAIMLGAIGVSGGRPEQDVEIGQMGLKHAGLIAE